MSRLSARHRARLEAFGDVILPSGGAVPGIRDTGAVGRLADYAETWRPAVAGRVRLLVWMLEYAPLPTRRRRFTRLGPSERRAWIEESLRSPLRRPVMIALKHFLLLAWSAAPAAAAAVGYDGTSYLDSGDDPGPAPRDYRRAGPAVESGTVSPRAATRTSHRLGAPPSFETATWPELGDGARLVADAVVIGSGAGGAVAACRLAEAGMSVVVLEEGPQVSSADFTGAPFERFQRLYRDAGTTIALGRPPIPLPLGRVVGGTTVVNAGTCFRAPAKVLTRWSNEFGLDAGPDVLTPYYDEIEDDLSVRPVPWEVLGGNGRVAYEGSRALGMSGGPLLRNITGCRGCGECVFGCPTDAKQAMHLTYLPRAAHAGARIVARCRAERVVMENGRVRGVIATLLGPDDLPRGSLQVVAPAVVVAAGAIHTPGLLARSGVPDPSRTTGRNLRIHPATGVAGVFPQEDQPLWKGTLQSYYVDSLFDDYDIMFEATTTVPGIAAGTVPGVGAIAAEELAGFRNLATLGFYISDTSRGRVRRLPRGETLITYRLNEMDRRRAAIGLAAAAEILMTAGASRVTTGLPARPWISSRADIEDIRERGVRADHLRLTAFHPMGTVRSGADPARAAVDPRGGHHHVAGLYVADASTFPTCVGVNPQLTIMAFAARTADTIAGR